MLNQSFDRQIENAEKAGRGKGIRELTQISESSPEFALAIAVENLKKDLMAADRQEDMDNRPTDVPPDVIGRNEQELMSMLSGAPQQPQQLPQQQFEQGLPQIPANNMAMPMAAQGGIVGYANGGDVGEGEGWRERLRRLVAIGAGGGGDAREGEGWEERLRRLLLDAHPLKLGKDAVDVGRRGVDLYADDIRRFNEQPEIEAMKGLGQFAGEYFGDMRDRYKDWEGERNTPDNGGDVTLEEIQRRNRANEEYMRTRPTEYTTLDEEVLSFPGGVPTADETRRRYQTEEENTQEDRVLAAQGEFSNRARTGSGRNAALRDLSRIVEEGTYDPESEEYLNTRPIPALINKYGASLVMEFLEGEKQLRAESQHVAPEYADAYQQKRENFYSRFPREFIEELYETRGGPIDISEEVSMAGGGIVSLAEGGLVEIGDTVAGGETIVAILGDVPVTQYEYDAWLGNGRLPANRNAPIYQSFPTPHGITDPSVASPPYSRRDSSKACGSNKPNYRANYGW